jgi:type VI secretion system secreted protein VgrG
MPSPQETRLFRFKSPLGPDALLLQSFRGEERLSQLFRFELELLSERDDIEHDEIVGKEVTLEVELDSGELRHWTGCISHFAKGNSLEGWTQYEAEMVPWLWFFTRNADSRVFQQKSAPDILREIFDEFRFRNYQFKLTGDYPPVEYCVQYQESTFEFVARLMEREGLYYFIKHEDQVHHLVVADNPDAHTPARGDSIRYHRAAATEEDDTISDLRHQRALRTGRVVLRDYNFETPETDLEVSTDTVATIGNNQSLEDFEFPGGYPDRAKGERYARLIMEAEETQHETFFGEGNVRDLSPGYTFKLKDHPIAGYNQEYLLCSVEHAGRNNFQDQRAQTSSYASRFTCIPKKIPYRPLRLTPKPVMKGLQSAVVVGPSGEEIYTDKYGRVKVQFHWDRRGKRDEKSSCWIRVAQPWAGKGWGFITIPRIGQEVLVDFLEGDPEQPMIVGSVYNAVQRVPYELPANATVSTLKSNSSKGGDGFNEFRFEDKKGDEKVFLHGEKNLDIRVKNNTTETIGNERHLLVEKDQKEQVKGDKHTTVDGGSLHKVGMDYGLKAGMNIRESAGMAMNLKAGMETVIEAGVQMTLKAGGSTITLGPAGVTIDGALVRINCGGSGGSAQDPDPPEPPDQATTAQSGEASSTQKALAKQMKKAARSGSPFVRSGGRGAAIGGAAAGPATGAAAGGTAAGRTPRGAVDGGAGAGRST